MHRTAHFKTSAPEEWTYDANQNLDVPGGRVLAEKLRAGVEAATKSVSALSPHSYYGWRFEVAIDDVTIECVLNAAGAECHLTIDSASILPAWWQPRRRAAFTKAEGVIDALLRQLPEIGELSWS